MEREQPLPHPGLVKAIEAANGQSGLGRIIGKRQSTISSRLHSGKPLWDTDVLTVETELGVSRHDLRPDLYPREQSPVPTASPTPSPAVGDCGPIVSCDRPAILQRGARP